MSATVDTSFFGIHEEIILTKNGVWLSNGEEITHQGTVQAFSRNLFRNKDSFEIRLGNERKTIFVEETIYFVTRLSGSSDQGYTAHLNDGREVPVDVSTLRYEPGQLTCRVHHPNDNTWEPAKFLSAAYYEILSNAETDEDGIYLIIQGKKKLL